VARLCGGGFLDSVRKEQDPLKCWRWNAKVEIFAVKQKQRERNKIIESLEYKGEVLEHKRDTKGH